MNIRSTMSKVVGSAAGALLLAAGALGVSGNLPFQDIAATQANEAAGDNGRPDGLPDAANAAANGEVGTENNGEGPDENASDTAIAVHEAREMALALEDAPPCAIGMYVSTAATGGDVPDDVPDPMPCEDGENGDVTIQEQTTGDDSSQDGRDRAAEAQSNGDAGTESEGAGSQGDLDGDGAPGGSGPPDDVPPGS